MSQQNKDLMRRVQIREILKRNRGSVKELARRLGSGMNLVSQWTRGRTTSTRVHLAGDKLARELLAKEAAAQAAESQPQHLTGALGI